MKQDLLIEIGCEELPARFVQPLAAALAGGLRDGLTEARLAFDPPREFATPRRIAVLFTAVETQQADQPIERRGPALAAAKKDGAFTPAATGFARSCGVAADDLAVEDSPKGKYLVYRGVKPGQSLAALLPGLFTATLKAMDQLVPRRMRWGTGEVSFVRPVHWLVALLGEEVVPLEALGCLADRITFGHRFHAPTPLSLARASDYAAALEGARVLADFPARRERIREQIQAECEGGARIDAGLLDEVTALVEWPVAIAGAIDARYLALPAEVIVTTIQDHQRYFPVFGTDGAIRPDFVTVANLESRDPAAVRAGNERVVRPRLEDAYFFWEQDRKAALDDWLSRLDSVTFIQGLGSVGDKARRMAALSEGLAMPLGVEPAMAAQAARYAKADLASQMVFEFPELQGIMGGHYARAQGWEAAICAAMAQHYQPQGPDDALPDSPLALTVALADKLDTLAALFSSDARPSSSKDPFGARRAAYGVIRILAAAPADLALGDLVAQALAGFPHAPPDSAAVLDQFLRERLEVWLRDQGIEARIVAAVLSGQLASPKDALARGRALGRFGAGAEAQQLAHASKRIRKILGDSPETEDAPERLVEPAEARLLAALESTGAALDTAFGERDYDAVLRALSELAAPVAEFFDQILVNAKEPALRRARLALIARFQQQCDRLADFAVLASG